MEKRKKGYKKKVFALAVCILLGAAGQGWMLSKQIYAAQKGTYASIGVPIEEVPIKGALIEEVSIEEASIEEAPIEEALMEKVSIKGTSIGEAYSEGKEPHFTEGFLEAQENGKEENSTNIQLYARSAVLMDADSGRVLFGKNENEQMPMASTTKIMTCILALENGNMDDMVTVSAYAASQPKVHLGMYEGQQFRMKDLLYSLMLESHNDAAVAIAEHIGGSVEGFAAMMNQKAKDIGCFDTFFITPNGLDASATDSEGNTRVHSTTARDLARMMKYCIEESEKKEEFLEITRAGSHSFADGEGKGNYSCNNHNAFLHMMDGALSGKTGFTNNAGYCYVGALRKEGKTFVVALLACGWPNNKNYKWSDTRKLMGYGLENYEYRNVYEPVELEPLLVEGGVPKNGKPYGEAYALLSVEEQEGELNILLKEGEGVEKQIQIPDALEAPVKSGSMAGSVKYYLEGELLKEYPIVVNENVEQMDFPWILKYIWKQYAL